MKIGRNTPCPCGSGKKYKACCLLNPPTADDELADNYDDDNAELDTRELWANAMINFRNMILSRKPHIKEYKKIRKLHSEVINGMIDYFESGKFEKQIDVDYVDLSDSEYKKNSGSKPRSVILLEADFDMETHYSVQAFYDMQIYKSAPNMNCITENFIKSHRYRKPEKIELLQSMLDSKLGLFEVTDVDFNEGYAYIREVFTGIEYEIIDIGLSSNKVYEDIYLYTRIITYNGISFGTGLNFIFPKTDPFIESFVASQKKDYTPFGEFNRFIELYNHFSKDPERIKTKLNTY